MLDQLVRVDQWRAEGKRVRNTYSELLMALWAEATVHERVFARAGRGAREDVERAFGRDIVSPEQK